MLSAVTVSLDEPKPTVFRTPLGEFKVLKTIGEGSYGKVKLVTNLVNNEKVKNFDLYYLIYIDLNYFLASC
jgi:hypothetical protein